LAVYESCIVTEISQNPASGLSGRPSARPDLCHLQIESALQSASGIIFPKGALDPVMKKEIHPSLHPVAFVDVSSGKRFLTRSTMKSARKEEIDGVEHYIVLRDVTSDSHPAYTGEKRLIDTAGRVEKFTSKFRRQRK